MKIIALSVLSLIIFSTTGEAKSGMIARGGLGFLFPDHNTFQNPGQFALDQGFGFETSYQLANKGNFKTANTSAVWGNGNLGLGAFGARAGTNLSTAGSFDDTAGGGIGFNLAKGRMTAGLAYAREISAGQLDDGRVDAVVTLNSPGNKGWTFGVGGSTVLNSYYRALQTGTLAVGYGLGTMSGVEADIVVNDMASMKNFNALAYYTRSHQYFYWSFGYGYANFLANHSARARLGAVIGNAVDLSLFASHTFVTGSDPSYGASLRAAF